MGGGSEKSDHLGVVAWNAREVVFVEGVWMVHDLGSVADVGVQDIARWVGQAAHDIGREVLDIVGWVGQTACDVGGEVLDIVGWVGQTACDVGLLEEAVMGTVEM